MQSATERDDYVDIIWDKIQANTENNFNKYGADYITNYKVEYDYGSVMHYGKTAFSIDGSDTIIPKKDLNGEVMGQRLRMSGKDIERLNRMYCDEPETTVEVTIPTTPRPKPTIPSIPDLAQTINNFVNNLFRNIFGRFN